MMAQVSYVQRRAAYWLMYGCGLLPGEAYNLTLDRIDLGLRTVVIASRAATLDGAPLTVKSDDWSCDSKERIIAIPEPAISDVTAACRQALKAGGYVCLTPDRFAIVQHNWRLCRVGHPWVGRKTHRPRQNADMVNNLLRDTKRYVKKAGVELSAPIALTTFPKSFAQNHTDAGTLPRTLSKLLRHFDTRVMLEFYNRCTDANEKQAAKTMDHVLGKAH